MNGREFSCWDFYTRILDSVNCMDPYWILHLPFFCLDNFFFCAWMLITHSTIDHVSTRMSASSSYNIFSQYYPSINIMSNIDNAWHSSHLHNIMFNIDNAWHSSHLHNIMSNIGNAWHSSHLHNIMSNIDNDWHYV